LAEDREYTATGVEGLGKLIDHPVELRHLVVQACPQCVRVMVRSHSVVWPWI